MSLHAADVEDEKQFKWQKGLASAAQKLGSAPPSEVNGLQERVKISEKAETDFLANALGSCSKIARATTNLRQALDITSIQSKVLEKIE